MKNLALTIICACMFGVTSSFAQYDNVYYDADEVAVVTNNDRNDRLAKNDSNTPDEYYEYASYDNYEYSRRINRFDRAYSGTAYYNVNSYVSPYTTFVGQNPNLITFYGNAYDPSGRNINSYIANNDRYNTTFYGASTSANGYNGGSYNPYCPPSAYSNQPTQTVNENRNRRSVGSDSPRRTSKSVRSTGNNNSGRTKGWNNARPRTSNRSSGSSVGRSINSSTRSAGAMRGGRN